MADSSAAPAASTSAPAPAAEDRQPDTGGALAVDEVDELDDEGYAGSDRSSLTSIASQIRQGIVENGRVYAAYGKGEYGLPRDDREMDRIDMAHEKYFLLLNHNRYLSPIDTIPDGPREILDLGTGTGIWAMDIAEAYPNSQVTGIDIAPIQPTLVPPNCIFEVDDVEADWTFRKESFDFIFARDLIFSIRDWPKLINQAYEHMKPGGWLELECIYVPLTSDDGTLTDDCSFKYFGDIMEEASEKFNTPLSAPGKWKAQFEDAGFELVTERGFKMPSNTWPKDKRMKMVGAFERENFLDGLEAMSLRLFQKGLGWSPEETQVLLAKVRNEIKNLKIHAYYPFHVVYGRKPALPNQPKS